MFCCVFHSGHTLKMWSLVCEGHLHRGTSPTIPRQPQAGDLGEEVGGGTSVGWGSGLKDEVPHAEEPKTRWRDGRQYQKARLEVLPAEDRTPPHMTIPALGEGPPRCPVLVVQVPLANERPHLQGLSGVEDAAEDSVGGGAEGDQKVEKQVDGPGPAGGREVWAGSTGFSRLYGRRKTGAAGG